MTPFRESIARAAGALLVLAVTAGAAAGPAAKANAKEPDPPVKKREYSYIWQVMDHSLVRPTTRFFDWPLHLRQMTGNRREAENVDENDQVRLPSTWWQPRIGFKTVTARQMLDGPGRRGPAPGKWRIVSAKTQGVTPGFQIKDVRGDRWAIKFDPVGYPELGTGAEVVGTHLFWGAGYNVPENVIATFRIEDLEIDPEATAKDRWGRDRKFVQADLDAIWPFVERRRDGSIRCVASRFLKGKPLGPFKYNGRRNGDPEDLIPHEHRRELRGLWTLAAWTNHADVRGPNSLDMWVTENGRSFVRHHLLDFSAILGSASLGPRSPATGTEYYIDFNVMWQSLKSVGLEPFDWEDRIDPRIPSVGMIEAADFDAREWRPDYPNPAFDEKTDRDIRWGARILAGFTDEHIRAAVEQAHYSDPRAAEYLTRVLIMRRDKLVNHWLGPGRGEGLAGGARNGR